ncbi:ATPase, AAA family, partial [human gut metagenome]
LSKSDSALQKSIRGSDADAAVHYLARLIKGGDLTAIIMSSLLRGLKEKMLHLLIIALCITKYGFSVV